jgi:glycogen debranching enzyme
MLTFDSKRRRTNTEKVEMLQQVTTRVKRCQEELEKSPWAGLTELTQKNGEFCGDSSPTQAWSAGCLIDLFYDAREVEFTA